MASPFVPVYSPDPAVRRLQDRVQRATTSPVQSPALRTESFDAAAGGVYRVRPTTTATLDVRLPRADAANYGKIVALLVSRPVGTVRVTCPTGTVNAATQAFHTVTGAHYYASDGDGDWLEVAVTDALFATLAGFGLTWDATDRELDIDQATTFAWTGGHSFANTVQLDAVISPTITANQNDWNPTGLATCTVVKCNVDATPRTVTGIVPPSDAGHVRLFVHSGAADLTLAHQSASSSSSNRLICPNGVDLVLDTNDAVWGWYDFFSNRWRLVGV